MKNQANRGQPRRLMYVELKSGFGDRGPARIGWVSFSRSGLTIYYGGKTFQRLKGAGISGNYVDAESGEEYWISGVKANGHDRHWAGSGPVEIDEDARDAYDATRSSRG